METNRVNSAPECRKIKLDQTITSRHRSEKEAQILDCALKLLIETGDAGLTMRRVADCAGMRLSNVQYYFKSRDDILIAMVSQYFDECAQSLLNLTKKSSARSRRDRIRFLVEAGLSHGYEDSDMCRAFREIWAISSRNPIIDQCLMDYYQRFADVLAEFVLGCSRDAASREKLQALLVPYFEGYSVTARSLSLKNDAVVELITDTVMNFTKDRPEHSTK